MKVRLKNHDYVNNVDAGTIFEALNERGGEFDYDFPYWHGWVKDRSGNRKFLSYSREDLELVVRPEIAELYNRIFNEKTLWHLYKQLDGQIIITSQTADKYKGLSIQIVLNPIKPDYESWIYFSGDATLPLFSAESLYLRQLYYSIKGEINPSSSESLEYLREILKQL